MRVYEIQDDNKIRILLSKICVSRLFRYAIKKIKPRKLNLLTGFIPMSGQVFYEKAVCPLTSEIIPTHFRNFLRFIYVLNIIQNDNFGTYFPLIFFIYQKFCCRKSCKIACGIVPLGSHLKPRLTANSSR